VLDRDWLNVLCRIHFRLVSPFSIVRPVRWSYTLTELLTLLIAIHHGFFVDRAAGDHPQDAEREIDISIG